MKLEFLPVAESEFLEAVDRYEARLKGLGSEFIVEVRRVTGVIGEHYSLGEKLDGIHRRFPLRRFPFGLIYRVDGQVVRIVAVAHRRRRPTYWRSRVQDR